MFQAASTSTCRCAPRQPQSKASTTRTPGKRTQQRMRLSRPPLSRRLGSSKAKSVRMLPLWPRSTLQTSRAKNIIDLTKRSTELHQTSEQGCVTGHTEQVPGSQASSSVSLRRCLRCRCTRRRPQAHGPHRSGCQPVSWWRLLLTQKQLPPSGSRRCLLRCRRGGSSAPANPVIVQSQHLQQLGNLLPRLQSVEGR